MSYIRRLTAGFTFSCGANTKEIIENDFVSSDYCTECGGIGHIWGEQCAECEDLHEAELRADRRMDSFKEGA